VQLGSGGCVADALLVDGGGGAADREAGGVVDQEEESQAGFVFATPGSLQWCKECLGQGEGVRPERVAGLEEPGNPGMVLQHLAQPMGEDLEMFGPGLGGVEVGVDLSEHGVKGQVLELLLVADVVVERAGDDPDVRPGCAWSAPGPRLGDGGECSATTCSRVSRVSGGRRSWWFVGALNRSERDLPSVTGWPCVAVAPLLGGGVARPGMLPLPDVPHLNGVLEIKQCLL
jgi:hypothetical protein